MVETGRDKSNLPYFTDDKGKFVPMWLAQDIMTDYHFATHMDSEELFVYEEGIYKPKGEMIVREKSQKRLGQFVKNHYVNETVEAVKRQNHTPSERFNNPTDCLAVLNGLLDVKEQELRDFSPEHIHLAKINAKYAPEADCPEIKEFIKDVVHDEDVKLIQEMFGYCLLRGYPMAKAFMLLGSGANGKSTLLELLGIFLDEENVANPSLQILLDNRFSRIELYGKLANIHADLSSKKLEETGSFKMLTGSDLIRGEKKYQDAIKFHNYAKLIYSANELPKTTDRTKAFFRRWIIVEFPYTFPETNDDTDTSLPESLVNEETLAGLLNWALEGLERILENEQFTHTTSRDEIEQKWIRETDSLRAFLDTAVETKTDAWTAKEDFYNLYKKFCSEHNIYNVKKGQVTKRLPTLLPSTGQFRPELDGDRVYCWENLEIDESFIKENSYVQDVQPLRTTSTLSHGKNNYIYEKGSGKRLDIGDIDENQGTIDNSVKDSGGMDSGDRTQQEKVEVLQNLAYKLGQEQGHVDPPILKKEAEGEGISEEFVVVWLQNQGESIHEGGGD